MHPNLEPIDDARGNSIGCIATMGEAVMAIRPDGRSLQCEDRAAAIRCLKLWAAGKDPQAIADREEIIMRWIIFGMFGVGALFWAFVAIKG